MGLRGFIDAIERNTTHGLRVVVMTCLVIIVAMVVIWKFVEPAPPKHVVIAAGVKGGDYDFFAGKYSKYFKENGFELEVKPTAGSVENWRLLMDPKSGVDLALVQGGTAPENAGEELEAVCSVYFEPLWVFYRGEQEFTRLSQLGGKRIAIGPEGSGLRALSLSLLKENGIDAGQGAQFLDATGEQAAGMLKAGEIDALMLVFGPKHPMLLDLLRTPGVHLMSFEQADAYARRFAYLSRVTLYEGMLDLGQNLPAKDVELIAPAATLVARKNAHQGTIELLVRAARAAHGRATPLAEAGKFPSPNLTDLTVSRDAEYYLRTPPSRLLGGLPFWMKSLIDRLLLLSIPLIALLVPLMRFAPALFRWSVRSRITRYYSRLHKVEEHLAQNASVEVLREDLDSLQSLGRKLATMGVPAGYMPDLYDLRMNLERLRRRLRAHLQAAHVS